MLRITYVKLCIRTTPNGERRRLNKTHKTYLSLAQLSAPKYFCSFDFILLFLIISSNITSKIRIVAIFLIDEHTDTSISHVICRHVSSPSPYQIL